MRSFDFPADLGRVLLDVALSEVGEVGHFNVNAVVRNAQALVPAPDELVEVGVLPRTQVADPLAGLLLQQLVEELVRLSVAVVAGLLRLLAVVSQSLGSGSRPGRLASIVVGSGSFASGLGRASLLDAALLLGSRFLLGPDFPLEPGLALRRWPLGPPRLAVACSAYRCSRSPRSRER